MTSLGGMTIFRAIFYFMTLIIMLSVQSNMYVESLRRIIPRMIQGKYAVGLDFGTTGARSTVVEISSLKIVSEEHIEWNSMKSYSVSSYPCWQEAFLKILNKIPADQKRELGRVCVSGTSASVLMYDLAKKKVTRPPRMYNFNVACSSQPPAVYEAGVKAMEKISRAAPAGSPACAPTSSLAKLLSWHLEEPLTDTECMMHQADFLAYTLLGGFTDDIENCDTRSYFEHTVNGKHHLRVQSDWHNVLKLGYDVDELKYPVWLMNIMLYNQIRPEMALPQVREPGDGYGKVCPKIASALGINKDCFVAAGTTDSIAAFYASQCDQVGEAVTSLGSTMVLKMLSDKPVRDNSRGIYSHRLANNRWLVGGASNVGCAVLRQENFSGEELAQLSEKIDPEVRLDIGDRYYPLVGQGERFPVNDPEKQCVLDPKPATRQEYLHGILQAMSRVEAEGYAALSAGGASTLHHVYTAGGGSKNDMWCKMRESFLGVPVARASNTDASFGVARLGTLLHDDEIIRRRDLASEEKEKSERSASAMV
jgi:sugar (pentulose or hexulose) kinase